MANELVEVVPKVTSMPTTGWFCQTSGNARRRVTKNSSSLKSGQLDIEGTFDVAGVPGHTHNANAVVTVDADYSKYRSHQLGCIAKVWGIDALQLPIGILTDSEEPDNASERYERAIERCVGYTTLFPENCTGHIREPTRSIGEIRTLVAPKARLDTLTYTEERGGWRIPNDANDEKEITEREQLVSDFPDIYIDVRPLTLIVNATLNKDTAPSNLFLESAAFRYKIIPDADLYSIGRLAIEDAKINALTIAHAALVGAGGLPAANALAALAAAEAAPRAWDGTLRFVWDDDARCYRTLKEVSVTLFRVREVTKATGVNTAEHPYDVVVGAPLAGAPLANASR